MNKKYHWFCFSYSGETIETRRSATANTYVGCANKNINRAIINSHKKTAGVRDDAVLISASYLGEMTRSEFLEEPTSIPED